MQKPPPWHKSSGARVTEGRLESKNAGVGESSNKNCSMVRVGLTGHEHMSHRRTVQVLYCRAWPPSAQVNRNLFEANLRFKGFTCPAIQLVLVCQHQIKSQERASIVCDQDYEEVFPLENGFNIGRKQYYMHTIVKYPTHLKKLLL